MKLRLPPIYEYGTIPRSEVPPALLRDWQRFDEQHALRTGDTVFDWSHIRVVKAKSYVGVLQIGDLQIEILPKIDANSETGPTDAECVEQNSRQNLVFMLSLAGRLPFHDREMASQRLRRLPLWEALIRVFVRRLLQELRRGQQHAYVYREEDSTCVKGRILIRHQVTRNAAYHHLIHVGYDEFSNDTWLNRILKAGCTRLLGMANLAETQQLLREALLELADVEERVVEPHDFDAVKLDRNSERFAGLLEFCRLIFLGTTPSAEIGHRATFSLLFPMEVLFEEFVGGCMKRFAERLGICRSSVHLQAESRRRWLLRDAHHHGRFRLKPDVLVDGSSGVPQLILDTKWKYLASDEADAKNGVQSQDIYQLYAYATRYRSLNNVLLFPHVPGVTSKTYRIDEDGSNATLRVEFLDLSYDLRGQQERLLGDFQRIVVGPGTPMLR